MLLYTYMSAQTSQKFLISVAPLTRITLTRDQSFFYAATQDIPCGTLVEIPVGRRMITGIVTRSIADFPRESNYVIKPISRILVPQFLTSHQLEIANFISSYYLCPLGIILTHMIPARVQKRGISAPSRNALRPITTTPRHEKTASRILARSGAYHSFLLHVYASADKYAIILHTMSRIITDAGSSKQILYLLPELIQVPFLEQFFLQFFPQKQIAIIHSKLGKGAYYDLWQKIKSGQIRIVVGTRSAVFLPFVDLGMIVVDDVHDMSHKQWEHYPLYDARVVANHLAQKFFCPIVLTSATPRTTDHIQALSLPKHTLLLFPIHNTTPIEIVDMKIERWEKNRSPLSRTMIAQIGFALKAQKQILIFVNRQGESAFSVCTKCRTIMKCPTCDRALSVRDSRDYFCVHCHYRVRTKKCFVCQAPIEHVGIGTQRIFKELQKIFPSARCAVADSSTMKKPQSRITLFRSFRDHAIDIVIGTQMITKGWHTDTVRLSVIVDMDNLLSLPAYDVNEKAFSFVVQMASRVRAGKLIVQTFQPENPVLRRAATYDFKGFYEDEDALRSILSYPPHATLIKMTYHDTDEKTVKKRSQETYDALRALCAKDRSIVISEPHPPLVYKLRTKYRYQIIIKCKNSIVPQDLRTFLIACDIKWSIDIDPIQLI